MRRLSVVVAVVVATSSVTLHAQIATSIAAALATEAADLADVRDEYRAAATNRDAAALTELFADDAVLVAADRAVVRGRQEIASYFANAFSAAGPSLAVTFTATSAESREGFGSETGRFEERVTGPDGEITRVSGVYVTIYRLDDSGRWRVAIEIRSRGDRQPLGTW
jgi:uncharacterized protein (TIGR02246 family)